MQIDAFGQAVAVEHQHVTGIEADLAARELELAPNAERQSALAQLLDRAVVPA